MSPSDEKIRKTLELLVALSDSRQRFPNKLSCEEQATLTISSQYLADSELTIFQFISALKKLSKKGYTQHLIFYDEHFRSKINEELKKEELETALKGLEVHDTKEISDDLKEKTIKDFNELAPDGKKIDPEELKDEFIKISESSRQGVELIKRLRPDEIGLVFILPFRNINRLLEKMDSGIEFEKVQDTNIWYEPNRYRLHIGKHIFSTAKGSSATRVHDILDTLFRPKHISELVIEYNEVANFNFRDGVAIESKRHYLSMRTFLKTNGKLRDIFINHSDRLEINPKYREDVN